MYESWYFHEKKKKTFFVNFNFVTQNTIYDSTMFIIEQNVIHFVIYLPMRFSACDRQLHDFETFYKSVTSCMLTQSKYMRNFNFYSILLCRTVESSIFKNNVK